MHWDAEHLAILVHRPPGSKRLISRPTSAKPGVTHESTRQVPVEATTRAFTLRVRCFRADNPASAGSARVHAAGAGPDAGSDRPLLRFAAVADSDGIDLSN